MATTARLIEILTCSPALTNKRYRPAKARSIIIASRRTSVSAQATAWVNTGFGTRRAGVLRCTADSRRCVIAGELRRCRSSSSRSPDSRLRDSTASSSRVL